MGDRRRRKAIAALGFAAWFATEGVICAFGQGTRAGCDEAMYVTMDPYGHAVEASVVKSYSLYGTKEIVDYGEYLEVRNMTDHTVPETGDGQVTFHFPEESDTDRFYFEGRLDPEWTKGQLPWDLTVTYRLNGVERTMEELLHAKGLVEITVDAIPDPEASEYYKNNMTLETVALVDMEKHLSVEAKGAQIQSAGAMKAVLFMALPGEEQHFELRIGTDDFEFGGLMFLMVPVTLSQLEDLEELRDAKDTVKDSAEAISDSLDVLLDSLEGMEQGLHTTVEGLDSLEQSRQVISGKKGGIYLDADQALSVLKELSDRGVPFTGYVEEARKALGDGNAELNDLTDLIEDMDNNLEDLGWGLTDVRDDLKATEELLNGTGDNIKAWEDQLEKLREDLERLKSAKKALEAKQTRMEAVSGAIEELRESLLEHEDVLGISPEEAERLIEELDRILGRGLEGLSPEELERAIASASDALKELGGSIGRGLPTVGLKQLEELLKKLAGGSAAKLDQLIQEVQDSIEIMETALFRIRTGGGNVTDVLSDSRELLNALKQGGKKGQDLIWQVSDMRDTVNRYHQTALGATEDAGHLIDSAVRGTSAMYDLMGDVEHTLKQAGIPLDKGAQVTIAGLSEALNHGIEGLSKTTVIRDAKTTVEDLVEDKWDEYTGERMNLLNADVNAEKVSFTSSLNPQPQSLQIILRTEGTGEIEEELKAGVDESFHAQGNFLDRIWNILKEIVHAIASVFR